MTVVVCPGYHSPQLTIDFLQSLLTTAEWEQLNIAQTIQGLNQPLQTTNDLDWLIFPASYYQPVAVDKLVGFLQKYIDPQLAQQIVLIGYSAGVVAALGAVLSQPSYYTPVRATIAVDGWGVPAWGAWHRLSHDHFTHWSSDLLGGGYGSFWAEPGVAHQQLWRSPAQTLGWWAIAPGLRHRCSAAAFVRSWLQHYGELDK